MVNIKCLVIYEFFLKRLVEKIIFGFVVSCNFYVISYVYFLINVWLIN